MPDDSLEVHIDGLEGLEDALIKMKDKVAKTAVRRALRSAGDVIKAAMVSGAPKDTGFLDEHFKIKTKVIDSGTQMTVGPTQEEYPEQGNRKWHRTAADVALFTEFGTQREAARPFMRPALDENADAIVSTFVTELNAEIEKAGS